MASPLEKKVAKSSNSYYCKCCDYITSKKFNWLKHLNTQKHLKKCHLASPDNAQKVAKSSNYFFCQNCNKKYKKYASLFFGKTSNASLNFLAPPLVSPFL